MASSLAPTQVAPVLSTPDTHIFEDAAPKIDLATLPRLSDEQLAITYEVERTVNEIRAGRWRRIALQFPDHMLVDSTRVFEALSRGLHITRKRQSCSCTSDPPPTDVHGEEIARLSQRLQDVNVSPPKMEEEEKLFILGDTSYGSCCVDEVAAEHVDADVIVHYGRSCLSPSARLPVIYVFTTRPLNIDAVIQTFINTYPDKESRIVLMADIPYSEHLTLLKSRLQETGYSNVFATSVEHNPSSPLPNRTVPVEVSELPDKLKDYQLFHISEPPTALLLTLSSRVGAIHIYPTEHNNGGEVNALPVSSAMTLRRRYALITRQSTVDIFGILINTLSVKNYLHIVDHVRDSIAAAGKKSYTFVVGKINAAKVANFSEIGGWVVIGCWESSLIESKEFWKPLITPFELQLALRSDNDRVWTGEWSSDFQSILIGEEQNNAAPKDDQATIGDADDVDSEGDSAPPEFDLRTGRYVSHSRPMRTTNGHRSSAAALTSSTKMSSSVVKRAKGDIAQIAGVVSPGAEFLRSKRTWQGLGSDFEIAYDESGAIDRQGAPVEEGRRGVARGYVVGDDRSAS